MQVFIVRNPSNRIRGLLRSVGVEVDTNVFFTGLTASRCHDIYYQIVDVGELVPGFRVTLVESTKSPVGYKTSTFGHKRPFNTLLDGISLRTRRKRVENTS